MKYQFTTKQFGFRQFFSIYSNKMNIAIKEFTTLMKYK